MIDCPYLSAVPQQLREAVSAFDVVLFAEICKDGPGAPLFAHACTLHNEGRLPRSWGTVAAARAYNPLGLSLSLSLSLSLARARARALTAPTTC